MAPMIKSVARSIVPRKIWSGLRTWKLRRSVAAFQPRNVTHDFGGIPLTVHLADPLGLGWYDHDWAVPGEFAILKNGKLRNGARVFDLGAHQGVVALMLAKIVGETGSVLAVEALPHNSAVAEKNRQLNNVGWLKILNAGISDACGVLDFADGLNGQVSDPRSALGLVRVPAVTIDSLTEDYGAPDVVYVDVEGFECHALRGAKKTLEHKPDFFVEIHLGYGLEQFGGSLDDVLSYFPTSEYELFMGSDAVTEFIKFDRESPMVKDRFFLVARHRMPVTSDLHHAPRSEPSTSVLV